MNSMSFEKLREIKNYMRDRSIPMTSEGATKYHVSRIYDSILRNSEKK